MTRLLHWNRGAIAVACCLLLALSAAAFTFTTGTSSQHSQGAGVKETLLKQIEESPEQPLRILGNDDSPLKLIEANVKEIPGSFFTRLTGRTTDLAVISSVPEARVVNASEQTVTRFMLFVRDPRSRTTRGIVQSKIALKPGETYLVSRDHFVDPEKITMAGEDGKARQMLVRPGLDSEKRWIQFAARPDLFVTIAKVDFEDGSSWVIKEGGEVK